MYNNLPENWIMRELKDFLDYEQPQKYIVSSTDYSEDYKTPVLTAGKSFVLGNTNETSGIYSDLPVIIFDDFTTASKYVDFPFKVKSSALKILKTNDSDLNLKYFSYFMQFNKFEPSTHKRYWISDYSKIKIAIPYFNGKPDYKEINYIVKTLDAVAEMIKLRKETIQLTKDLIPAIFQEMFGDSITNPKGWGKKYLGQVCDVRSGNAFPERYQGYIDGKPFYKVGDISRTIEENHIYLDKAKNYITDKIAQIIKAKSFSKNTIVFAKVGEALRLNRRALISKDAFIDNNVMGVSIKEDCNDLHYLYLYYHFVCNVNLNFIKKEGAIPSVNNKDINSLYLPVPPLSLQKEFADNVEQINQNLEVQQKDLDRLQELFDQLLQKAFTGELTRGEDYGKH